MHLGAIDPLIQKHAFWEIRKWRVVLILARLLEAIATFALNGRAMPPTPANAIHGYITCKGPLEGELSTTPLAHMEDSSP
jgi:hypothetical protein